MDITALDNYLWEAACSIRGPIDAPKFKDYIPPLLFYKRLSDVYDDEIARLAAEFGDVGKTRALAREDRADSLLHPRRLRVGRCPRQRQQTRRTADRHDEGHRSRESQTGRPARRDQAALVDGEFLQQPAHVADR